MPATRKAPLPDARYVCTSCGQPSVFARSTVLRGQRNCARCTQARERALAAAAAAKKHRALSALSALPRVAPRPAVPHAPPSVRVTCCPGYTCDPRYAVADDEAPGLFSALGIGHYLGEDTPWKT